MASYATEYISSSSNLNSSIEFFIINASSNINCVLPTINSDGETYLFKRIDNNILTTVTLTAAANNTINNNTSYNLSINNSIRIVSYDNNYIIIN